MQGSERGATPALIADAPAELSGFVLGRLQQSS